MIYWGLIILGMVGVIAIFSIVKFKYIKHKLVWVLIILFLGALYLGYVMSISKANIDWSSSDGVETAVKLYFGWFAHAFTNMKTITGDAINMDWAGSNSSKSTPSINSKNSVNGLVIKDTSKYHK